MSTLLRRVGNVYDMTQGDLRPPANGHRVLVLKAGGIVSTASTGATLTLYPGHGFEVGGKIMLGSDTSTFSGIYAIDAVTSTTIHLNGGAYATSVGDRVLQLGPDSGVSTPNWDGSSVTIYSTPDTTTALTGSIAPVDTSGEYAYWHSGTDDLDEVVLAPNGAVSGIIVDAYQQGSAIRYAHKFPGADIGAKIANAIADLPATGGVVDARSIEGSQTCSANPFAGVSTARDATGYLEVLLGAVTITTDAQWALPGRTIVRGIGRDTTTLIASSSFPVSTALGRIGRGNQAIGIHGSRFENMTLNCNNVAGSIGIYSTEANEQCGGRNLLVYNWMARGLSFETSGGQFCDNFKFEDLEVTAASTATAGVGAYVSLSGKRGGVLSRITFGNANTGANQDDGIYVAAGGIRLQDIHIERYTDGVHVAAGARCIGTNVSNSVAGTNLIHLVATEACAFFGLDRGAGSVTVLDDTSGGSATDSVIAHYETARSGNGYQTFTSAGRSATVAGGVAHVQHSDTPSWIVRSTATSGGAAIASLRLYDGSNNGAVLQNNASVSDKPLVIRPVTAGVDGTAFFYFGNTGNLTVNTANGAQLEYGQISELITLSTSGATTDSSANLLPANSFIEGVVARVTTTITTATDWSLGDATTAARFAAANATLTAGTTGVGLQHLKGGISTDATGPIQVSAAKLRITTTGTPGAGAIRVTVFYRRFVPPTS